MESGRLRDRRVMVSPKDDGWYLGKDSQRQRARMMVQRHSGTQGRSGRGWQEAEEDMAGWRELSKSGRAREQEECRGKQVTDGHPS